MLTQSPAGVPEHPVVHVIDRRRGGRSRRGSAARLDDGRAALLHRGDEGVLEPARLHHRQRRLAVNRGVMQIGILGRRVIAPDDDLLDRRQAARRSSR